MSGQLTESTDQIYFIQSADNKRVKIGISKSPIKRLRALQVGSSERLELLFYVDGWREVEHEYHRVFAHLRHCGEWFDFGPDLRTCMIELWRNRQAHRASLLGHDGEKFYSFLRERNYTWENKVAVSGILYWNSTVKPKTGLQIRAIQDYKEYINKPPDHCNQQVTENVAPMQGGYVPV